MLLTDQLIYVLSKDLLGKRKLEKILETWI